MPKFCLSILNAVVCYERHQPMNQLPLCSTISNEPVEANLVVVFQVIAHGRVRSAGQAIRVMAADTRQTDRQAAALVKMEYTQVATPVLTIKDALKTQSEARKPSSSSPVSLRIGDADDASRKETVMRSIADMCAMKMISGECLGINTASLASQHSHGYIRADVQMGEASPHVVNG